MESDERRKTQEEIILGAMNSNNPREWLKNYAMYHGIAIFADKNPFSEKE